MSENSSDLIKQIKLKYKSMYEKMHEIDQLRKDIKSIQKNLFKTCEHDWIRDWDEPSDSRCKWKCKHCELSRNTYLYTY